MASGWYLVNLSDLEYFFYHHYKKTTENPNVSNQFKSHEASMPTKRQRCEQYTTNEHEQSGPRTKTDEHVSKYHGDAANHGISAYIDQLRHFWREQKHQEWQLQSGKA